MRGAQGALASRRSACYILSHMVQYGSARLEEETAWIERHQQLWDSRFDELDKVIEELKQKEKTNGRSKKK